MTDKEPQWGEKTTEHEKLGKQEREHEQERFRLTGSPTRSGTAKQTDASPRSKTATSPAKSPLKMGPAHYFWMLVLASILAPGVIALWRLALGLW